MRFTLLDNGADSLKGAYDCLVKFEVLEQGTNHNLKDAVMHLNHGIEILLKLILKKASPALMFTDIKAYQKAKEDLKNSDKDNVFQINSKLHTVSLEDALLRVEYLCDIEIPDTLNASIRYINKIRNQFMHYEVEIDDNELSDLINKLKLCYEATVEFLENHIENLSEIISQSRFEYTRDDYEADMGEWLAELRAEEAREDYYSEMMDALEDYHRH